ncbi:MAG TPA: lipid-A-disaccharide synthase [Bryobacteraceae bacterium]|nr:lipid-A-disaccharide synthase [Bryobacteraceae bacterium]
MRIFISAGEASGDLYASSLVQALKARHPEAEFFGCAGPRMQAAGVRAIVDQRSLAVVGIIEVIPHIPRILGEMKKLERACAAEPPDVAILTDSPSFHLPLARKLHRQGVSVIYLIAPQAWAWKTGRVKTMRATLQRLLCIFPFEEDFFRGHGVPAVYIGHPLSRLAKPRLTRGALCSKLGIPEVSRIVALLPGSRQGEVARHLPIVLEASKRLQERHPVTFVLALPAGFGLENTRFWKPVRAADIKVIEGHTWDALAQAELALAASGTVTIEAAMQGTPMVTFYRVNALSWYLQRWRVRTPFLTMVNLVAGRQVVPELIQDQMTAERIASEASLLLSDGDARQTMCDGLSEVAKKLGSERDPMETAADWVEKAWMERAASGERVHAK